MVTSKQIAALKYLIAKSKDGNDTVKRILFLLIDSSNGLTEQVSISLVEGKDGYTRDEIDDAPHLFHAMISCNCSTHLNEMMKLMGVKLLFSNHYGHYDETGEFNTVGMFPGWGDRAPAGHENDRYDMPIRYTFWLAEKHYGHSGQGRPLATPSRQELTAIDITKPGLYPFLETA